MTKIVDISQAQILIVRAMNYYQGEKAPAWFTNWLDDLYIRLSEAWREITLDEIATLSSLRENECWMAPTLAANTVYKLFDRLGRDTTGIAGF